jgi:DNA polymerase elongation subunit (family B)
LKILLLDIETAPNLAHVWGLWDQNIGINQLVDAGYTMCWSAKWLGSNEVMFESIHNNVPEEMLRKIHILLDQADAVIHYIGSKFDIPTLNKEFLLYGLAPPAPYKQIDLLKVARNTFKFPSNKLDYVAKALKLGQKTKHIGHELWIGCMNHHAKAWEQMEEYNKQDVILLEKIYYKLLPWIKGHANQSIYAQKQVCPNCGGSHYHKRGFAYTNSCKYQRYQCLNCGGWFRDTKNIGLKAGEKFVHVG